MFRYCGLYQVTSKESRHEKICVSTKNQISLIRVFVVRRKKFCILGYSKFTQRRFWSVCANAQAYLNLQWAHILEGTLSEVKPLVFLHYFNKSIHRVSPAPWWYIKNRTWLNLHYRAVYHQKTCLYNFDPLKPHFYIVKLGFTGVSIIFLISAQNIDCGYSLEPPRRGGSNGYPQSMFWAEIWKNIRVFYLKNFWFWRWNFLYIWIGVFS